MYWPLKWHDPHVQLHGLWVHMAMTRAHLLSVRACPRKVGCTSRAVLQGLSMNQEACRQGAGDFSDCTLHRS